MSIKMPEMSLFSKKKTNNFLLDHMIEKGLSTPERQAGIRFVRDLGEIRQILAEAESGR